MENQTPIYVFATWKVKDGQIGNILNLLKTVHNESVKETGNLFYKIHQSTTDANTLVLFEGYINEAAIEEHRNSRHYQEVVLEKIIALLDSREVVVTIPVK